jgi:hypothetical protein
VTIVLPPGRAQYDVTAIASAGGRLIQVPQDTSSPHAITVTDGSGNISITH